MWKVIVGIVCIGLSQANEKRPLVVVYTEAQHSDCIQFYHNSLKRSLLVDDLHQIVILKFVPYGNTLRIPEYPFYFCGHSKSGCYGNRLQSCATFYIRKYLNHIIKDFRIQVNGLYVWNRINITLKTNLIRLIEFVVKTFRRQRLIRLISVQMEQIRIKNKS